MLKNIIVQEDGIGRRYKSLEMYVRTMNDEMIPMIASMEM
jgi:hypothetical protein